MGVADFLGRLVRRGRPPSQPQRDTIPYATMTQLGSARSPGSKRALPKPTPRNLRSFARTQIIRRAVNTVKNPLAMLDWEIVPKRDIPINAELERQIEVVTACLESPNHDDSFRTLLEQLVEDIFLGAGAVEIGTSPNPLRPLWMWPVDGLSIQMYPGWSGAPAEARYSQVLSYGSYSGDAGRIDLASQDLMYIRPNPSTGTPFGLGAVEVAFSDVSRFLATGEFAGNVASNQRSSILIDLGDVPQEDVATFRTYWTNEVEGQGSVPIVGFTGAPGDAKSRGVGVEQLYPEGDSGLFLKYQELLVRFIANAFDISPQNLGIEADVNKNTSEVASDRDWSTAIKPMASLIESHINRDVVWHALGFSQVEFRFRGIGKENEISTSVILERMYKNNVLTPNEWRDKVGMKPSGGQFSDLTFADTQIAMSAARGTSELLDPELEKQDGGRSKGSGKGSRKDAGSGSRDEKGLGKQPSGGH